MHQKFQKLRDAPALGNHTPSQLLADLSCILGTIHQLKDTSTWFLKTEFRQRLPANVRAILSAFYSMPLIDLAEMAIQLCSMNALQPLLLLLQMMSLLS